MNANVEIGPAVDELERRKLQGLFDRSKARDARLNTDEICPTGDTYNDLYADVAFTLSNLLKVPNPILDAGDFKVKQ